MSLSALERASVADCCHETLNTPNTELKILGILYAIAYIPFAAAPKNTLIIVRSDTLISHHAKLFGIKAYEYEINCFIPAIEISWNAKYLQYFVQTTIIKSPSR